MGGAGAGYASAITYWLVFCIALLRRMETEIFQSFSLFSNWEEFHLRMERNLENWCTNWDFNFCGNKYLFCRDTSNE